MPQLNLAVQDAALVGNNMIYTNETKDLSSSLDLYYTALSHLGYIKYGTVDKLLALAFISELLEGKYIDMVSEEAYRAINKALESINGTACQLPYSKYCKLPQKAKRMLVTPFRINQDNKLKSTEDNNLRKLQ